MEIKKPILPNAKWTLYGVIRCCFLFVTAAVTI